VPVERVYLEGEKVFLEGSHRDYAGPQWQIRDEVDLQGNLISIRRW